jgi:hypothetical protein
MDKTDNAFNVSKINFYSFLLFYFFDNELVDLAREYKFPHSNFNVTLR